MNGSLSKAWDFGSVLAITSSMIFVYTKLSFGEIIKWNDLSFLFDRSSSLIKFAKGMASDHSEEK